MGHALKGMLIGATIFFLGGFGNTGFASFFCSVGGITFFYCLWMFCEAIKQKVTQ